MERKTNRPALLAAGVLIGLQAASGMLMALVLFASGRRLERWTFATRVAHHRLGLGLLVLAVALAGAAIAAGVLLETGWARVAAYVFEGVTVVGALVRVGLHPVPSVLSVALAMAIVVLLASSTPDTPAAPRAGASTGPT
jgi:hypothetical protein